MDAAPPAGQFVRRRAWVMPPAMAYSTISSCRSRRVRP